MYIGNATLITQKMWVYDSPEGMNHRDISFVPGLYKIFDEILVNASDNKQRDDSMTEIRVTIDVDNSEIAVYNDGAGNTFSLEKLTYRNSCRNAS
jgi:DNA topoisomerase-2